MELVFNEQTIVERLPDTHDIPKFHFNLLTLKQASSLPTPLTFDLMAIADSVGPVESQRTKEGQELSYRNVVLRDEGFKITMKVWSESTAHFNRTEGQILLLTDLYLKEFNGSKSLSFGRASRIFVQDQIPEMQRLKELLRLKISTANSEDERVNLSESSS